MQETVEGNLFYSTNNNYSINQVTKKTGENIALKTVNPVAFKPIYIVVIVAGIVAITTISITIPIAIKDRDNKKKPIIIFHEDNKETEEEKLEEEQFIENEYEENEEKENEYEENEEKENEYKEKENEEKEKFEEIFDSINFGDINEDNFIKTTFNNNFIIPADRKIQVVGSEYPSKDNIFILDKNNRKFIIDNKGFIKGVTKDDFPLYYSFIETITNASCLFKDVKCFKTIDLSTMDSSKLIDASRMFENSHFEEIYFGTNFNSTKIITVFHIFINCVYLKKIVFPPTFNVGKNAKGMFKGCIKLEEVDTKCIISNIIEDIESMFEDCRSLKEIIFSNDFLTGEIKSLAYTFKNTHLTILDISFLRLFNLVIYSNVFEGASINGTLKIGKYYSSDSIRDNLFIEISRVTDSKTIIYVPSGTNIDQIFRNIYYLEKNIYITVIVIDIDYNINYRENENYILYSNYLHIGLGWDYDYYNVYDLDSSVVAFDSNFNYLNRVNYQQLNAYNGAISLNGDDVTGEGGGDDEEIRISLDLLPPDVKILTVQLNSFKYNILKNVKSAYIRLSTQTEVIGTYSITQVGDNIGLLIGSFSKSNSSSWSFKPLNRVIPGHVVTESIYSIQQIIRLIYQSSSLSGDIRRLLNSGEI